MGDTIQYQIPSQPWTPVANPVDAYAHGYATGMAIRQQNALIDAGNQAASGNGTGAVNDLLASGNLPAASAQRDYNIAGQNRAAMQGAAADYAQGNYQGAGAAAAPTGDLGTQEAIRSQAQQQHALEMAFTQQQATKMLTLLNTPPEQGGGLNGVAAAFDAAVPTYKMINPAATDGGIAQLRASILANPQATLTALGSPPKFTFNVAGDNVVVGNEGNGQIYGHYTGTKFIPLNAGQGLAQVGGDSGGTGGGGMAPGGPGAALAAPQGVPGQASAQTGVGDPRAFFKNVILPQEGGLNPSDMNGSPTNFGINQAANPGVDVRSLTPDTAADIFASKYYGPSGAANLPPGLAAIHADTAFINPSKAKQFLAQSGGDPAKYMALRQAWMAHMVATNPAAAKYAGAWGNRNAALMHYAGQASSGGAADQSANAGATPVPSGQGSPMIGQPTNGLLAAAQPTPVVAPPGQPMGQSPGSGPAASGQPVNDLLAPVGPRAAVGTPEHPMGMPLGPSPPVGGQATTRVPPTGLGASPQSGVRWLVKPSGFEMVPGSQVPNGNPHSTYQIAPTGEKTEMKPEFGMADVQSNRKAFYDSDQYKGAQAILAPLQALDKVVSPNAPNGVVQIGINDALNKAFNPGGVIRASTMKMTLNHLGLPADVEGEIRNTFGDGFLTPQIVTQMGRTIWSYARAHVDMANQRAQGDQQIAGHFGFKPEDVGETAPPMPPVPKWAQDPRPTNPKPGQVMWSPKGPAMWTGKGWVLQ